MHAWTWVVLVTSDKPPVIVQVVTSLTTFVQESEVNLKKLNVFNRKPVTCNVSFLNPLAQSLQNEITQKFENYINN